MLALLLAVSASATTPQPPPIDPVRRVRAPVIAASFGGALLGGATSITVGLLAEEGSIVAATLPIGLIAGAAIPTALMTDGRAGYVTLGAGIGMTGGWLAGMTGGAALGTFFEPQGTWSNWVGAAVGIAVLGTVGAAAGSLVAASLDIKGQEKNRWTLTPTYLPQDHVPAMVFSGRF